MKEFLRSINGALEGFRGLMAIWLPIGSAYFATLFMGLTVLSKEGIITAAQLSLVPTVKLIWTDAIPKMVKLYKEWLEKPDETH